MTPNTARMDRPSRSTSKGSNSGSGRRRASPPPYPAFDNNSSHAPPSSHSDYRSNDPSLRILSSSLPPGGNNNSKPSERSGSTSRRRHSSPGRSKNGRNGSKHRPNLPPLLTESSVSTAMDDSTSLDETAGIEAASPGSSVASLRHARERRDELSSSVKNNVMRSSGGGDNGTDSDRNVLLGNNPPSSPAAAASEDDAKWHDCIKRNDWDTLQKMIKKFDGKYYKKKRRQAKEQQNELALRLKQQEEEEANAAEDVARQNNGNDDDNDDDDGDDDSAINRKSDEARPQSSRPQSSRKRFSIPLFSSMRSRSPVSGDPGSATSSPRRSSTFLPKVLSSKFQSVDPSEVISPLVTVDVMGRTPLHLACIHKAPESMILDILAAERKAAQIRDKMGQLPLHCAVQAWQFDHLLEKIIKSYPNALRTKDNQGRTPVGLAIQLARLRQEEVGPEEDEGCPYLWSHPTSKAEKRWQFRQEKNWSKVNFLLRDLMKRNKSVIPSEHGLILEALEAGANPNTINRLVSTADKYLMADDELAGTAIGLCIERNYCLDTLEYLMRNCRERTTIIIDSIHKGLRNHYRQGCIPRGEGITPFGKQVIEWTKEHQQEIDNRNSFNNSSKMKVNALVKMYSTRNRRGVHFDTEDDEDHADYRNESDEQDSDSSDEQNEGGKSEAKVNDKKDQWIGMDKSCKDWWVTLNHLVFYCAYGRNYKETVKPRTYHLLHAALALPVVPPSLIQLLLIVYPEAPMEICPLYKALPVHVACTRWKYDVIRSNNDASLDRVLKLMLQPDPEQVYRRHKGRLPIHMALSASQSWIFVKPFVLVDKKSVGMRDPYTKFFPFQMAALPISSKNIQLLMRNQFTPIEWRTMSVAEKKEKYRTAEIDQDRKQIATIYELLRRHPDAIVRRPLYRVEPTTPRSLTTAGKISLHYLNFVYGRNVNGIFKIRSDNVKLLRDAIVRAEIQPELDPWWGKMKDLIWNESAGDIPKTPPYLLHAALYNTGTPPLLVELLLQLFPSSAAKPIPGTKTYPLHIAAGTMAYQRHPFEMPYGMDNLHLVLLANKRAVRVRSLGRLPLHICLSRGKTWKEVRPLVTADPSTLMVADAQSGLLPFQLLASFKLTSKDNALRYSAFIEKQTRNIDFHQLSVKDKAVALSTIQKKQELNQLTCIFELLRHRPSTLTTGRSCTHATSGGASVLSSAALSLTSRDDDFPQADGTVGILGQFLNARSLNRAGTVHGLNSPIPPKSKYLAPLSGDCGSGSLTVSPPNRIDDSGRQSLSFFLADGGGVADASSPSLTSRTIPSVYQDYVQPTYDDDAMSNTAGSANYARLDVEASLVGVPRSTRSPRRGKRPEIPIRLPDLDS